MDLYFPLFEEALYNSIGYSSTLCGSPDQAKQQARVVLDKVKRFAGKGVVKSIAPRVSKAPDKPVKCLGIYVFNTETLRINRVGDLD